jgi:hypothetical protein
MSLPSTTPGTHTRARTPFAAIVRRVAVAGALVAALCALSAPTASAQNGFVSITTKGGYAEFNGFGEGLFVSDEDKDGYGVVAELRRKADKRLIATVVDGSGDDQTPNEKNLALDEGLDVQLRMCYVEDLWEKISCSGWQNGEA